MFRHYLRHRRIKHNTAGVSYLPPQIAAFLGMSASAGTGMKLAVIELGGAYNQADLDAYFKSLGLKVKPVVFHSIDGAENTSDGPDGADGEVMLDLCVAGGIAPGVELHCYTAANTDDGFLAAIKQARLDGMNAISISWGAPEDQWDAATVQAFNAEFAACAAAGIVVTAAAGDNGSGDGERGKHVDFPASSPSVIGCGGTSLKSLSPVDEEVWNDGTRGGATGGGISTVFARPAYQPVAFLPTGATKRCVPDVGGCADPEFGWNIVVDGQEMVIGGTSAVAPMVAAIAVGLKSAGATFGTLELLAALYGGGTTRDVTKGNNGAFVAASGYDCCTGMGVPSFTALLAKLKGAQPSPPPVPAPPPAPTPTPAPTLHTLAISAPGPVLVQLDGKTLANVQ